jgi:hypothetical protein
MWPSSRTVQIDKLSQIRAEDRTDNSTVTMITRNEIGTLEVLQINVKQSTPPHRAVDKTKTVRLVKPSNTDNAKVVWAPNCLTG